MMNMGEIGVIESLKQAISFFKNNASILVPYVFNQETQEHQNEILEWWTETNNMIIIQFGFAMQTVSMPQIAVTINNEDEEMQHQVVGSIGDQIINNAQERTSYFTTQYTCHCYGHNVNWVFWTQILCKWALLVQRRYLEANYDLIHQHLSLSPFLPSPDSMKDVVFPFERRVMLTADHLDSWFDLDPYQSLVTNNVVLEVTNDG